jgi:hypothetical protein
MNFQLKSIALGFVLAFLFLAGAVLAFLLIGGPHIRTIFHAQTLPSGKNVKVTMCNFAWGVEHEERHARDDCFVLEYVSTVPHTDLAAVDRETVETFELIRPISELWGLNVANVSAFPAVERKGKYFSYVFTRNPDGRWSFTRKPNKVFNND